MPPRHDARCESRAAQGGSPSVSERYGKGAIPIPPADEQRPVDLEVEAVSERPEEMDRSTFPQGGQSSGARTDGLEEERQLPRWGEAEAHRAREELTRGFEHEELSRYPGLQPTALQPEQHVRTDLLRPADARSLPARWSSAK